MSDKKNETADNTNRRNVLKALSATAGSLSLSSAFSGNVIATQGETTSESDIEIVDATLVSEASVSTMSTESNLHPETQKLLDFIEQKSGLTGVTEVDLKIDIETDDEEYNSYDPAVEIIPFGSDKRKAKESGSAPQKGAGLLFVHTVAEDGGRVPVGIFGMTSQPIGSDVPNSSPAAGKRRVTSYALDDGKPVQAKTQVVSPSGTANSDVTTQISVVCASCQTLVDSVCVGGARVLGQYGCTAACSLAFGANFIAIFGCASICSLMFTAISAVGCTAAGSVICEEMTDLSPSYITFC